MALLTVEELETYAPEVTGATSIDILVAQTAIEAWLGFSIEQTQRIEILQLTVRSKTTQLSYHPIADTPAPVIEVRQGNERDRLDRQSVVTDWLTLQAGDYVLDATGLISLNTLNSSVSFGFNLISATDLRATYTAGLDFTQDTPEINALKAATGQIIAYQASDHFKSGVIELDIKNQFRQKWASGSGSGGSGMSGAGRTPETLFRPFQKYKPRSGILAG
ncbi:hypothetical protein N836_28890 [Leptolyngbya sp. Heron Island J]|uniref:hypothetical protein n=1 Tax=Leptolyngbya sp. Heron Island J TaxID=1385935 RepID=UPI0003B98DFE|nr:hypothetical protein [Leptolyngbya sp. Heron Island J]ESA39095.1 hypothetical protein N836_28890 [Leptolyngbya sp. Heron Island J]